jgi:hypothetical protein
MKKAIALMILATACSRSPAEPTSERPTALPEDTVPKDASTSANLDAFVATHLVLDLTADFTAKTLSGTAELTFNRRDPNAREVVLDTRDLKIEKVEAATGSGAWMATTHRLDSRCQPAPIACGSRTPHRRPREVCSGSLRARLRARSTRFSSARRKPFRRGRSSRYRTRPVSA